MPGFSDLRGAGVQRGGRMIASASEPAELISPWTPVKVKTNAWGVEVGVWGRAYKLANTGALPETGLVLPFKPFRMARARGQRVGLVR